MVKRRHALIGVVAHGEIRDRSVGRLDLATRNKWGVEGWLDGGSLVYMNQRRGTMKPLDARAVAGLRAEWGEGVLE